jgi:L-lactate dehydrogenase (cytochrome)
MPLQPTEMPSSRPPSRLSQLLSRTSPITCIEDLRVVAERRVPRMFYDYADSGSYTEGTYRANTADFAPIKLRQRCPP